MTDEAALKQKRELAAKINLGAQVRKSNGQQNNQRLREALQRCIESESLIPAEQAKFEPLIAAATSDIERNARIYQRWLVEQQLTRAALWGRKRLEHLNALRTQADWDAENTKCAEDTIYWFRWWAWSTDPRPNAPLTEMPFVPFPFQEKYIHWIEYTAFTLRTSGLVEKSRDMGATVGWVCWDVKQWRFRDGFTSLLSTVDEDLVDSKKDPDTLFEKVRFQIKLLPEEMLPRGFELARDMPYMNIENAENHSVITGEAPTENIGRQRRRTVALFDEFASWRQGGYPQHTSASQTVPSIFKVSSVKGMLNKFAEESHSGHANIFRMNWRDHPWKTPAWYDALPYGYLGPPMTKEEIAQEVDCNYEASQPGRVFPEYNEVYHVITWSEFARVVPMARNLQTGNPKIPDHWLKACGLDWGATSEDEHPCALVWVTRAAANAPSAIRDCVFVYRERLWGNAPTVGDVAREVRAVEAVEKEYVPERRLSHERSTEQATFAREHKMGWAKWQTVENWGVSIINEYLRIDPQKPHPFRPMVTGKPRLYLIAADGQGELLDNEAGQLAVTGAVNADGLKRLRAEMPVFHYPESEKGKPVKEMRPMKFFDDAIAAFRGVAGHFFVGQTPLTKKEYEESQLPEESQAKTMAKEIQDGTMVDFNARWIARLEAKAEVQGKQRQQQGRTMLDVIRGNR